MVTIVFIKEVLQSIIRGVFGLAGIATSSWIRDPKKPSGRDIGWIPDSTAGEAPYSADRAPPRKIIIAPRKFISPSSKGSALWVGLPPRSDIPHARRIREQIRPDMAAKELIKQIADRLGVNENKWTIVVFSDDNPPRELNENSKIEKFLVNRSERLYFYPKAMIR